MTAAQGLLLAGSSFEDETFSSLELTEADLSKKEFVRCTFRGVKLAQSRWHGALLEDCSFDDCDLTRAVPAGLSLQTVEFTRCKLIGIDWVDLRAYPFMTFVECNLSYGSFDSITARKMRFVRCELREASFKQVDLAEARFDGCQLAGAQFEGCDLRKANFEGSTGLCLEPSRNRVQGACIPLEAAVLLATSFGLRVAGFSERRQE